MAQSAHLRVVSKGAPTPVNRTVPPQRAPKPADVRKHLTPPEVERMEEAAARRGRYGHRDRTLVMLTYRHGLRVSELVALRWEQMDLESGALFVTRRKKGKPSTHPLRGPEIRALRRLPREQQPTSPYVFTTERGGPMTEDGVRKLMARVGQEAGLPFHVHPHMLRHACGYKLAADGQTRGPSRPTLAMRASGTRCATRNWPRAGSRTSGRLAGGPSGRLVTSASADLPDFAPAA
jgi:type 1 fimbriae regulatory protein FimE